MLFFPARRQAVAEVGVDVEPPQRGGGSVFVHFRPVSVLHDVSFIGIFDRHERVREQNCIIRRHEIQNAGPACSNDCASAEHGECGNHPIPFGPMRRKSDVDTGVQGPHVEICQKVGDKHETEIIADFGTEGLPCRWLDVDVGYFEHQTDIAFIWKRFQKGAHGGHRVFADDAGSKTEGKEDRQTHLAGCQSARDPD